MESAARADGAIRRHSELTVFQRSFVAAMRLYEISRSFPAEERYSLTDQMRRSSRSVCANIAEAWRKRRYPAAFISKLSDAEGEAAETQVWLRFARDCGHLSPELMDEMTREYDAILGMLVNMIRQPEKWKL